jgi:sugar phosphate isomerase/epimerase
VSVAADPLDAQMHERISVHQVCFPGVGLAALAGRWRELGTRRVTLISPSLLAEGGLAQARAALASGDYRVETVCHNFVSGPPLSPVEADWRAPRDALSRLIDITAELGGRSIYLLTGGHGTLAWGDAAEAFSAAIAPCVEAARAAEVALAVENASALYADLHIAHSLADTLTLAEMAGVGICIDLYFCWAEAELRELIERAMPICQLIQLSDYVYGDRFLPARAVPGDGVIPLERIIGWLLEAGYHGAFDLELLGPRIDAEGHLPAVRRAAMRVGALLTALGG